MDETVMIPYFAHEGEMSRMERANKRLWIVILVLIVCLVGSNVGWLIYESQFESATITEQYEATADGNSNAVLNGSGEVIINGGNGQVYPNGESQGQNE